MLSESVSESFFKYFRLIYASTPALLSEVYKVRYDVFCKELELEKNCPADVEKDEFDDYSIHYLLQHRTSNKYAGTIRLVLPPSNKPELLIPLEKYCPDAVDASIIDIKKLPRGSFAEVSRLAVPASFRKRTGESGKPYVVTPEDADNATDRRHFPHIAIGLYLAAASLFVHKQLDYIFVMTEPRLARALSRVGLRFEQMGDVIEYHGQRAPFFITPKMLNEHLKPDLKKLYQHILSQVRTDITALQPPPTPAG